MTYTSGTPRPLRGIIPPMVTPLNEVGALDHLGLERLIEHLIAGGVHGLFILGTTGEGPALTYKLRRELIDRTCEQVAGRIPVLVNITDTAFEEACDLASHAVKAGADGVVTAPPFYFAVSQGDLFRLVQSLSQRIDLPLYLYNMPSLTKTSFAPRTVIRAAELPNVWGMKDSSGDIGYLQTIVSQMKDHPEFAVLEGPEELLLDSLRMGVHGGVNGGANLLPKLFVSIYDHVRAGQFSEALSLQNRVQQLGELLYGIGEAESSYLRGLKLGLELIGICKSTLTAPFLSADSTTHADMREKIERMCAI